MSSLTAKRIFWSAAAVFLVVGSCFFLYTLKLIFTESLYSRRGSLAFFVTVTEPVIRDFPVPDSSPGPQYHSGCGDGPKLPDQAIFYRSHLHVADLLARVQSHVMSHGFTPSGDKDFPGIAFVSGDKTLYLNIATADDGMTRVDAQVWFNSYR